MRLELPSCIVRPWRHSDKAALLKFADNPNVSRGLTDRFPFPYTPEDADWWLTMASTQNAGHHFAIEVANEAVGGIGFEPQEAERRCGAEIGYWLGEPFWGKGIATESLKAVTAEVFATTDLLRLQAGVYAFNTGSARVLEKAGYVHEGTHRKAVIKRGEIHDLFMYAKLRKDA
jgi:RimJ/RimL family protein N-acetyltransferase